MLDTKIKAKPWYKSKSFWFGILHVVAGITTIPVLNSILSPKAVPIIAIVSGLAQVAIRTTTKGPMTTTETKAEAINEQVEQITAR